MGSKGTNTTTTNTGPNPAAAGAYNQLLDRAQGVASTPYQAYGGDLVAPVNAQQQTGIGNINQNAGFAQPYIQQAAGYATNAAQPLTAQQIQQYQNPYTQNVVNATQGQFNLMNEQALNNIQGNAAAQGALGGDRVGVAKSAYYGATLPGQEQQIAGLYNQGYSQALQTAQQQQQNQAMAAYSLGNLGVSGQNAALTGANAQIGAGTLEQQTQQAQLGANYGQFQLQQAFPYQQTQWLAGLDTGVGSQMGGTSSTTGPAPNPLSTIAGLGLTAAGAYFGGPAGASAGAAAGKALGSARGGRIAGFDDGGPVMPWSGAHGWIPGVGIVRGHGAPPPPNTGSGPQGPSTGATNAAAGVGNYFGNRNMGISTDPAGSGLPYADSPAAAGFGPSGYASMPFADPGIGFVAGGAKRGGRIAGFADGGAPSFDDQWASLAGLGSSPSFNDRWASTAGASPSIPPDRVPLPVSRPQPRQTVAYAGGDGPTPGMPTLNADTLGLGSPYDGSNAALVADAGGNPGRMPPAGVAGPAGAPMAYGPGYDRTAGFATPAPSAGPQGGFFDNLPGRGSLSPAVSQGLMAAGLGMMASRSPFLGVALGEGGLRGLGEYTGEKQREFAQEQQTQQKALEGRKVELKSQKLGQEADRWAKQIALETKKQAFTENQPRVVPMGAELVAPQGPNAGKVIASNTASTLDPASIEILGRRLAAGDATALSGLPQGTPGAAARTAIQNKAAEVLTKEGGMSPTEAASTVTARTQDVHATGIGLGAGARTAATREANLNIILKATEAAIPAAIEASEKLDRTGWVPLNRIIQGGRVIASDPDQKRFGMANLQLAEHWARAMNPTGVMRESDRDMALGFLNTADSKETYRAAVDQLHTQIERERAAVQSVKSGAATPAPGAAPAGGGAPSFTGRTATGPSGAKLRETSDGQWVP